MARRVWLKWLTGCATIVRHWALSTAAGPKPCEPGEPADNNGAVSRRPDQTLLADRMGIAYFPGSCLNS
jgi:hypothetical protein